MSTRQRLATITLGLCVLGYSGLFVASLITPLYALPPGDWTLSDVHRIWPAALAAISLATLIVFRRPRGALLGPFFVAWFMLAALSAIAFNLTWGGQALLAGLIALVLCLPDVTRPSPGSRIA